MIKMDLRKELNKFYNPSAKEVELLEIPEFKFAMIDGDIEEGKEPGNSPSFQEAMETLYGVSYTLKFSIKQRKQDPIDYPVMALEGLWWIEQGDFDITIKDNWKYTLLLMQPEFITIDQFQEAIEKLRKKRGDLAIFSKIRFESFHEGLCMQIMHIGPYANEMETVEKMKVYMHENRYHLRGKHHEIYLGDPRRSKPEKLKTILRYPIEK